MRLRTGSIDMVGERHRARLTVNGKRGAIGIFDTRAEAERELAAALAVLDDLDVGDDANVGDWCESWLTARELSRQIRDFESDWSRFRTHIATDEIAAIGLRALRRGDVKAWLARVGAKVAPSTAKNCLNVLRGALGAALDDERVRVNVAAGIKVARAKRTEEPWTHLAPLEQAALIEAIETSDRWIVAFAIGTGLRAGELVTLRLADVHEDHIVVRYGTAPNLPTKTGKIRRVPLFGLARRALAEWRAVMPTTNPHKLLFPRVRGGFRSEEHVIAWSVFHGAKARGRKPAFVGALERAGITRNVRWHDLRHTCASSLVSGSWGRRWSLEEVRDLLGHESIVTTQRYAHLAGTALETAAKETAIFWPEPSQVGAPVEDRSDFLNRRSQVRFLPGAPREIKAISDRGAEVAGQLVADSFALLAAAARGDAPEAHRLAALVRGDTMMRAIDLAEAVVAADQLRRTAVLRSAT